MKVIKDNTRRRGGCSEKKASKLSLHLSSDKLRLLKSDSATWLAARWLTSQRLTFQKGKAHQLFFNQLFNY